MPLLLAIWAVVLCGVVLLFCVGVQLQCWEFHHSEGDAFEICPTCGRRKKDEGKVR